MPKSKLKKPQKTGPARLGESGVVGSQPQTPLRRNSQIVEATSVETVELVAELAMESLADLSRTGTTVDAERHIDPKGDAPVRRDQSLLRQISSCDTQSRIELERSGVAPSQVAQLIEATHMTRRSFSKMVGLASSTLGRKLAKDQPIGGAPGQAVIGVAELILMVESIVSTGDCDDLGKFDAARWFGAWVEQPQPALAGYCPAELMDTPTGRESVKRVLGAAASGAYQ